MIINTNDNEPSIRLPEEIISPGVHMDIKFSGAILVSKNGITYHCISDEELPEILNDIKDEGTFVLYTRETPEIKPSDTMLSIFRNIVNSGVPIRMLEPED